MQKITLIAGGSIKNTPEAALFNEYAKRIRWPLKVIEVKSEKELKTQYLEHSKTTPCWILLDETGKNLNSIEFAKSLSKNIETYQSIGFIIGVDTGIPHDIKDTNKQKISFGQMTWPHMLARVLLIEQIYRAQQILANHPYHREG